MPLPEAFVRSSLSSVALHSARPHTLHRSRRWRPPPRPSAAQPITGSPRNSRVMRRGDPVMRQGVVHVLHVHHVVLLIPDAVLPREQVREELAESQRPDRQEGDEDRRGLDLSGLGQHTQMAALTRAQKTVSWPQVPRFVPQNAQIATGCTDTFSLTWLMFPFVTCILRELILQAYVPAVCVIRHNNTMNICEPTTQCKAKGHHQYPNIEKAGNFPPQFLTSLKKKIRLSGTGLHAAVWEQPYTRQEHPSSPLGPTSPAASPRADAGAPPPFTSGHCHCGC